MKSKLAEMSVISSYAGSRKDFVQGGGGNTSVKVDQRQMVVKASGYLLKQVTEESGYAWVNYEEVREYYQKGCKGDVMDAWNRRGGANLLPSIEMTFHSVLGNYVIHTHSIYVNVLTCSLQGRETAQRLFHNEIVWVPYQMPGDSITQEIIAALDKSGRKVGDENPIIIFMNNHGLIISANSAEDAMKTHEFVNNVLINELGQAEFIHAKLQPDEAGQYFVVKNDFSKDTFFQKLTEAYSETPVLFPDQLVYTHSETKNYSYENGYLILRTGELEANALFETIGSYDYILTTIMKNGYDARYLTEGQIDMVLNNEQEKYRKEVIRKNAE